MKDLRVDRVRRGRREESGVAFILVLSVMMALMVLAVPFLSVARNDSAASVNHMARAQARTQAESMLRYARYVLQEGHYQREKAQEVSGAEVRPDEKGFVHQTPDEDLEAEAQPPVDLKDDAGKPMRDADGDPLMHHDDSRGLTVDLDVRDESSLPNILSSPAFLLAARLGRSQLASDITNEDTELSLEEGEGFPLKNGYLNIEGELIKYAQRDGNEFTGLERGQAGGMKARAHRAEVWAIDDRAREIAMLPFRSPRARPVNAPKIAEVDPQGNPVQQDPWIRGYREPVQPTYIKEIALLGRDSLSAIEVDRLLRGFTNVGGRYVAGGFGRPTTVRASVDPIKYDGNGFRIQVSSIEGFNQGTVVRISDGRNTEYGLIARVQGGIGFGNIILYEPTESGYEANNTIVQPLIRHPLNVNSASEETLVEVMTGLQFGPFGRALRNSQGVVSQDAAEIVAEGIVENRPVKGLEHFREILSDLVSAHPFTFTEIQAQTVFRNAVFANDMHLTQSSVPFCFASSDYYTVEARAVVNDQSGRELAQHGVREIVRVAPSGSLSLSLSTQEDFEHSLVRAHLGQFVTTHPYPVECWTSNTAVPWNRFSRMFYRFGGFLGLGAGGGGQNGEEDDEETLFRNGVFPNKEEGDVRLLPALLASEGFNKHFFGPAYQLRDPDVELKDIDPEGFRTDDGPYELDPRDEDGGPGGGRATQVVRSSTQRSARRGRRGRRGGGGGSGSGAIQGSGALQGVNAYPIRFDLFYRFGNQTAGQQTIFDYVGQDPDDDRITLSKERDGSLLARIHGRTIDDTTDEFEEVMEVRFEPENGASFWESKTWYHLGLAYRGTRPDDSMLFVDGFKRGRSRYQTRLTSGLAKDGTSFTVENADDWPQRGVCWVGTEVVAFERNGNSFDVVQLNGVAWGRGQRGSRGRLDANYDPNAPNAQGNNYAGLAHGSGEPVSLFGYSILPRRALGGRGVVIPQGNGRLNGRLGPMAVATFVGNHTETYTTGGGGPTQAPIRLTVFDPAKPGGGQLKLNVSSDTNFEGFPEGGGYVVIASLNTAAQGSSGELVGGLEFLKYSSRSNDTLLGLQAVNNPPNSGFSDQGNAQLEPANIGDPRLITYGSRIIHPVKRDSPNSAEDREVLSVVFPVSIPVEGIQGFIEPTTVQENSGAGTQAPWNTYPEFVQIGQPDLRNLAAHSVEWIRYHHVDPQGHLLCDEVRNIHQADRSFQLGLAGFANAGPNAGTQVLGFLTALAVQMNSDLSFREQCGTDDLNSGGRHGSGAEVLPCIRTVSFGRRWSVFPASERVKPVLDAPVSGEVWSPAGWGDKVTIEGRRGRDRIRADVAWAGLDTGRRPPGPNNEPLGQGWIAFAQSLGKEYRQSGLPGAGWDRDRTDYVRILKFPCGELPYITRGSRAVVGGDIDGSVTSDAQIDEIRITRFEPDQYVVWDHVDLDWTDQNGTAKKTGVQAGDLEIPIARVLGLLAIPQSPEITPSYILPDGRQVQHGAEIGQIGNMPAEDAGLVMIGEEIIAYRSIGVGANGSPALLDCVRGFMDTVPVNHSYGENVVWLDFLPVTKLSNAIDARGAYLEIADGGGFLQSGGLALVDNELIHYTEAQRQQLRMPWALDPDGSNQAGLFRGRFGTLAQAHDAEAIVLDMPFRYWDRYAPQQDSGDLGFYGLSLDLPGAYFHRLDFEKERQGEFIDIEVLCRTDGDVPWTADPQRNPGLFLFEDVDQDQPNFINRAGSRLDVRVFFKYLNGAFDPVRMQAHDWKKTPILNSLSLQYFDESRVLYREALR